MLTVLPENLEVAKTYLETGSMEECAIQLRIPVEKVSSILATKPIRDYLTAAYLDAGYRNRFKLAGLLDKMIDTKVEEAMETQFYTKEDLLELMKFAHKLRMDEIKAGTPTTQTNIQVNQEFGQGNYGELMKKLMG